MPRNVLIESHDPRAEKEWVSALKNVATGTDDTVGSTRTTLAQVVDTLTLSSVNQWVAPVPGMPNFVAADFLASTDTLVLVSDNSSSTNVGPLCTMLLQESNRRDQGARAVHRTWAD